MIERADAVGSTTQLIEAAARLPHSSFIVATDRESFTKCSNRSQANYYWKLQPAALVVRVKAAHIVPGWQ